MKYTRLITVACVLVYAWLLSDCATERSVNSSEDQRYLVYVGSADLSVRDRVYQFYVYDADSLTLIDSIPLPSWPQDLEISEDGKRWYLTSRGNPYGIVALDAETGQEVWSIEEEGWPLSLLDDDETVVYGKRVLAASSGAELLRISDTLLPRFGGSSGTWVAAIVTDTAAPLYEHDTLVTAVDVRTGATSGAYVPRLPSTGEVMTAVTARLLSDGRRVCVVAFGWYPWFAIGDLVTGETLLLHRLASAGEIAVNPQGTIAVASSPGIIGIWERPIGVDVFDLVGLQHLKWIPSPKGPWTQMGQVRFFPDGRRAFLASPPYYGTSGRYFQVLDVETLELITIATPRPDAMAGALAIGSRLD